MQNSKQIHAYDSMKAAILLDYHRCLAPVSNLFQNDRLLGNPPPVTAEEPRIRRPLLRDEISKQLRIYPDLPVLDRAATGVVSHSEVYRGSLKFRGLWKRRYL
jgi:hypothetical protein